MTTRAILGLRSACGVASRARLAQRSVIFASGSSKCKKVCSFLEYEHILQPHLSIFKSGAKPPLDGGASGGRCGSKDDAKSTGQGQQRPHRRGYRRRRRRAIRRGLAAHS